MVVLVDFMAIVLEQTTENLVGLQAEAAEEAGASQLEV
jgi:hypothetical protein